MNIHTLTPFVRYALIVLATYLARGGWLPPHVGDEIANDPAVVELVTGLIVGAGTIAWYLWSKSRKALRDALNWDRIA